MPSKRPSRSCQSKRPTLTNLKMRSSQEEGEEEQRQQVKIKDELSLGAVPGEVKPQKACVSCRRSKVKCVHDGGPPCRRCHDSKQECKFRLRADDETWRERTDETLSKLADAVDTLLNRQGVGEQVQRQAPTPPSHRPVMPSRNMSAPGTYMHHPPYSPDGSNHVFSHSLHHRSFTNNIPASQPLISPYSDQGLHDYKSPSYHDAASSSDTTSPSLDKRAQGRKREAPVEWDAEHQYNQSTAFRSPSSSTHSIPTPLQGHQRLRSNSAALMPPPLPPAHLDQDQIMPSPILSHVSVNQSALYIHGYAIGLRWMMGNTTSYAKATLTIGRDDPRMNAISIGLVVMDRARSLFVYFAEKLQPHSFGFPTYPASEQMTPVIISSILMVAALHDPQSRQHHYALKKDCLASIKPEQDVQANQALDPELGIGVEEITGACIASAWLGGETGWRISRVARWWTIGYLKHFEIPSQSRSLTLGECLTILPPFRQIDLVDKLRIWLAAFVAEAQQAFVLDRPSLVPNQNPVPYVEALRNAFNDDMPSSGSEGASQHDTRGSMTGGSGGSVKYPPPPDRQLMGHAGMLHVLLGAQRVQRDARWAAEAATAKEGRARISPLKSGDTAGMTAVRECVDRLVAVWNTWMTETERWKAEVCSLEDLSSSTASAMDLTLTYYLTKTHLGSLALEPEYNSSTSVAKAASVDPRLLQAQSQMVNTAKNSALAAMNLAISPVGFRDRLIYLPGYYHFLLGHSAGFLLLLVQRKWQFMLASEAKTVLETVESFSQIYTSDIASHNFHPHSPTSPHPGLATAEALSRSCQHLRMQARGS